MIKVNLSYINIYKISENGCWYYTAFPSQIVPQFLMQGFKTVLFQSCFLCFVLVEIPFFLPSSLCVLNTTPQTPQKIRVEVAFSSDPSTGSISSFFHLLPGCFCLCLCVYFLDQQSFLLKRDLWHLVHSLHISVTVWAPSISARAGTASQSKPTVLSLNICSLLSEMRKSLRFPSMWRLKWRACLKTDCAKLGVYLNSTSTLLTWKYILNW